MVALIDTERTHVKKKLRTIVVQGMVLLWKADWFYHPDQSRILRIRIWGKEKGRQPLFVNLTSKWIEYPIYWAYPVPKDISMIITYALTHGWNPLANGEAYWLKEGHDQVELENWLLTDVGRLPQAPGPLPEKRRQSPLYTQ